MANNDVKKAKQSGHFPEHGPIDPSNGKEILLSVKDVDITFGKGDNAVRAVKNASFDVYKGETFSLVGESPVRFRTPSTAKLSEISRWYSRTPRLH